MKEHFSEKDIFRTRDITEFYRSIKPDLKKSTINWRVYHLVKKGVLERIGRGTFKIGKKITFVPQISSKEVSLAKMIQARYPYSDLCIWNTSIINRFMLHQPFRFMTMVEVDKDSASSIFNYLREEGENAFLKPGREIIENYLQQVENPVVVRPLITEAPIQEVDNINTITIEKLLVDLFSDEVIFSAYQGNELNIIFKEVFSAYTVNEKKLLRYADRRKRKSKLIDYLEKLDLLSIGWE